MCWEEWLEMPVIADYHWEAMRSEYPMGQGAARWYKEFSNSMISLYAGMLVVLWKSIYEKEVSELYFLHISIKVYTHF